MKEIIRSAIGGVILLLFGAGIFCVGIGNHATAQSRAQVEIIDVVVMSAIPAYAEGTNGLYYTGGYQLNFISKSANVSPLPKDLAQALSDLMSDGFTIEQKTTSLELPGDPGIYTLIRRRVKNI